jgi:hypothetical protein
MSLGVCVTGCSASVPATTGSLPAPRGATVAFESIDGLPEGQFRKLVQSLDREAEARNLAVVSRTTSSQYRIRGYASAQILRKQTTISWLWDVYDNEYRRVLRISGEEQGRGARGWAAADDQMIAHMAQNGMDQLAVFLTGGPAPSVAPVAPVAPAPAEPTAPEQDSTPVARIPGAMRQAALVSDP